MEKTKKKKMQILVQQLTAVAALLLQHLMRVVAYGKLRCSGPTAAAAAAESQSNAGSVGVRRGPAARSGEQQSLNRSSSSSSSRLTGLPAAADGEVDRPFGRGV